MAAISTVLFTFLGPEGRKAEGIEEELIRLSVGIEDVADLKADLDQALK